MPDMPGRNSLVSSREERDCCISDDDGMSGVTKRLIKFLVKGDESTLASLGAFLGILALNYNHVVDNTFREKVSQPRAWCIKLIEGDNVNLDQMPVGPHIDERGIEFRGMTPDATSQLRVGSYHLVHVSICKNMQTCVTP